MPRKGMSSICFQPRTSSFSITQPSSPSSNHQFAVEQIIDHCAEMIMKWNPEGSTYARVTSMFHESRREAAQFIRCVENLQKAMHFLAAEDSSSPRLVQAYSLMQVAMKRLQKEFYSILSTNRAHLDPDSVSSRASARSSTSTSPFSDCEDAGSEDLIPEAERVSSTAMEDLKTIAECMIWAGYAKECVAVYKIIRKSVIDEGIYRLGFEKMGYSQLGKMDSDLIELKIKNWLEAVKIAMMNLFTGERILCDTVFASSDSIRESCFAEISKEGATILFRFPEMVVKNKKMSNKLIFRLLDMYSTITHHWPEIESVFSYKSTSEIRSIAENCLLRIGDSVRATLAEFECTITKESSKSPVPGAGVHCLTRTVMDYLTLLSDYNDAITDIFQDSPLPEKSSLPESYLESSSDSDEAAMAPVSARIAWLILVLLCKLDGTAERYRDPSMSYLFLANNLRHVLRRVAGSNLRYILGEEWIAKHEAKARRFAANYERFGWGKVLPMEEEAEDWFKKFNANFEQAIRKHSAYVVPDRKLRDEVKASIARKIVPVYGEFYEKHKERRCVKYSPEDVANHLSDLFLEMTESESESSVGPHMQSPWEVLRNHLSPR